MDLPPQSVLSPQQIPPRKSGCSCCAMGCVSMVVVAFIGLALILAASWWLYAKGVDQLTASQPNSVQLEVPNEAQYAAANDKLVAIRAAAKNNQSTTVQFTAAELNALVARHPDFEEMRGKFRVAMADSIMTLDLSAPLSDLPFPRVKKRWLNGTARFGLVYNDGDFSFALRSLHANERELPIKILQTFASTFDRSFNEGFDRSQRENDQSHEFWDNVKTLAVIDDTLVVTTKGPEIESDAASPTPTP